MILDVALYEWVVQDRQKWHGCFESRRIPSWESQLSIRLDFEAFDERIMSRLIFERRVHKRTHYCWNANGHIMLCWFALPCSFNFFRNFNPEMKEKNAQYVLRTKKRFCLQTLLLSSKAPENYSSSCNLKRPHSMNITLADENLLMSMESKLRLAKIQCHWELQAPVFTPFAGHISENLLLPNMTPSPALCDGVTSKQKSNWLRFLPGNFSRERWSKSSGIANWWRKQGLLWCCISYW